MVVARKKEVCKQKIVDHRDVDMDKAAHAVVHTEYVCEEFSTRLEVLV